MIIENLSLTEAEADEVARDASERFLAAKASGRLSAQTIFSDFYCVHFAAQEYAIPKAKRGGVALVLEQIFDRVDTRTGELLEDDNE